MTRSTDWPPLCGADPTPGDPDAVQALGDRFAYTAEDIARQAANLTRLGSHTGWESGAGEAFSEHARDLANKLTDAHQRYATTGSQLRSWSGSLEGVQERSEALRVEAQAAEATRLANAPEPWTPPVPDAPAPTAAESAAEGRRAEAYSTAGATLGRCQRDLEEVVGDRDRAAAKVAEAIRDVVDDDLKDSWWERRKNDVAGVAGWVNGIADVLGYIATAMAIASLFIPGVNLLVAAAWLTVAALSAHLLTASTGNGSWLDVGLDTFALATFGLGGPLLRGFTKLGVTVRGAVPAVRAASTAAAPRLASAAARTTRLATHGERVALSPRLADPAVRAAHTALKAQPAQAAAQMRAVAEAGRLGRFDRLKNLLHYDADLGRLASAMSVIKPFRADPAVAAAYTAARRSMRLATAPGLAGGIVEAANLSTVLDGMKAAPVFHRQIGGSW